MKDTLRITVHLTVYLFATHRFSEWLQKNLSHQL